MMTNDRQIMENILLNIKGECDLYMHGAMESSTPDVHSTFTKMFNEALQLQNEVYHKMAEAGWYPSTQVEQQKIDNVKSKYNSMS